MREVNFNNFSRFKLFNCSYTQNEVMKKLVYKNWVCKIILMKKDFSIFLLILY